MSLTASKWENYSLTPSFNSRKVLSLQDFHGYQYRAVEHGLANPQAAFWIDMGLGKLQPNSEPVLTPAGWVGMGYLGVGDEVIGVDGSPTKVTGVFPHPEQDIYRVTLNDGSWTRCGLDHLWRVQSPVQKKRGNPGRVLTTQQLMDEGLYDSAGNRKHHIPVISAPVQHPEAEVLIEPYLLGVLLGDGHLAPKSSPSITSDIEILSNWAGRLEPHPSTGISTLHLTDQPILISSLTRYGLRGKRSWEKYIPSEYLVGSAAQRLALLQGLLDTDGSWCQQGVLEFSSTSENLADGVVALTQSLGGVARKAGPRNCKHQNGIGRDSWHVNVRLPADIQPFRLLRKLNQWVPVTKYPPARLIASIELDGREEATCIAVASPDHLYVTRGYVVTHNTISALTVMQQRMDAMQLYGTLVLAPLRVCQTVWSQEAKKWEHTGHLTFSLVHGTQPKREIALLQRADVYLVNYENTVWLVEAIERLYLSQGKYPPFNMVVLDESSKMKNAASKRHKALQRLLPYIPYRLGLTGTPAANGYKDLFGQYLALDGGQRLGFDMASYERAYFVEKDEYTHKTFQILEHAESAIKHAIGDITIEMAAEDYLTLPPVTVNDIWVDLPPKVQAQYDKLEKDMFIELDSGAEIEVFNASAKANKLLQYANGACYVNPEGEWAKVHDHKLDVLEDIVEESAGTPVICFYEFRSDVERILKKYPGAVFLKGGLSTKAVEDIVDRWNRGEIPLMLAHPASAGHGLNLQYGGHTMVWFGLTWSLELYQQAVARLARQGQEYPVMIHRILARLTYDVIQEDSLVMKDGTQTSLRNAVKKYREAKYGRG